MTVIRASRNKVVLIGGIAHAGARGISKVEVQMDDGPWAEAHRPGVTWKYNWPFHSGKHTFTVRCYEGNGTLQIATPSPAEPPEPLAFTARP